MAATVVIATCASPSPNTARRFAFSCGKLNSRPMENMRNTMPNPAAARPPPCLGPRGEGMRADCNANDEIAEDRRKAKKTAGNDHDDGRCQQQQNELQCLW